MKALRFSLRNGKSSGLMRHYYAEEGSYFTYVGSRVETVGISYGPFYKVEGSFGTLNPVVAGQLVDGRVVKNLEGFATRSFVLKLLSERGLKEGFVPYSRFELLQPITYAELGYLLTYAVEGVKVPSLGHYPLPSEFKVSVLWLEDSSTKEVDYRLGQYSSTGSFDDYLEDIRVSRRPVPLPVYYGFQDVFGRKGVKLFGQVSRSEVFELLGVGYE